MISARSSGSARSGKGVTEIPVIQAVPYWIGAVAAAASVVLDWSAGTVHRRVTLVLRLAGIAGLAVFSVVRWFDVGHPPIFGTFENTVAASVAVLVFIAIGDSRPRPHESLRIRLLGLWVPLMLAYGLFFDSAPLPLTISERSILVDVHILFAWSAYAMLLSAGMAALALLIGRRDEASAAAHNAHMVRGLGVGFALYTGLIVVGAIYSQQLFSEWFLWEVVEVLSVAAWVAYGLALHAHLLFGWQGRRLAWLSLAITPLMLSSFWVWSLYSGTYHYFDITPVPVF